LFRAVSAKYGSPQDHLKAPKKKGRVKEAKFEGRTACAMAVTPEWIVAEGESGHGTRDI